MEVHLITVGSKYICSIAGEPQAIFLTAGILPAWVAKSCAKGQILLLLTHDTNT